MSAGRQATGHPDAGSPADPRTATSAGSQAISRVAELARTSLQVQASLTRLSVDLTWGTVVKDLDRVSANRAYLGSVARESARYWRTVGGMGVDCAGDLVTMGRGLTLTLLRAVAAAGRIARTRNLSPEEVAAPSVGDVTPIRAARRRTSPPAGRTSPRQESVSRAGGDRH